jgi:hypothetical protein
MALADQSWYIESAFGTKRPWVQIPHPDHEMAGDSPIERGQAVCSSVPGTLRPATTSLIGRESEVTSAFRDADPVRALEALRRGLVIAQDSANRFVESQLATGLSRLEAEHGGPLAALDHITLAIRNFYESGNVAYIRGPLATLAVFLDRLGRYEPAARLD